MGSCGRQVRDGVFRPRPFQLRLSLCVVSRQQPQIQQAIEDELWWSPFVDAGDIVVTVDNGVARLTGTVDSWPERRHATENAYEGGASRVVNDLLVASPG